MKKVYSLIFCLFVLLMQIVAQDDCKELPKRLHGRLVNDSYNKIEDGAEGEIEALLRRFNDSTSIEIAVITINDIGYEDEGSYATKIGNCWGVGKSKYDNGIILFVSFEGERAWYIATGKGIEQYLTDFKASSIGQENLIPNLQAGNTNEAFKSTVNAIINHLGWKSWEMRDYWNKWDKETAQIQKRDHNRKIGRGFGVFFTWLFYLFLSGYVVWCIWWWNKEIKIKREIKNNLKSWEKEMKNISIPIMDNAWPKWAHNKINDLNKLWNELKGEYMGKLNSILEEIKTNPQNAKDYLLPTIYKYYNAIMNLPEQVSKIIEEKVFYEKEALSKVRCALKKADKTSVIIDKCIKDGFLFGDYSKDIILNKNNLLPLKTALIEQDLKPDLFKEFYDQATKSEEQIKKIYLKIKSHLKNYSDINSGKDASMRKIKTLGNLKIKYSEMLERMQKEYPENVWKELKKNFLTIEDSLKKAKSNIEIAYKRNKGSIHSLDEACKFYNKGISLVDSVAVIYKSIDNTLIEQKNAKQKYNGLQSSAKSALESAAGKCNNSHVKSEAKNLLEQAHNKMKKAEVMLSSGIVDWVWLVALLASIKEISEQSYSKASSDISSYNYHHSSSSSHSSPSSDSSSSFGGFGGGSFGGGGAGGHW